MDRTAALSFYVSKGITSLSQIKDKVVSTIDLRQNGDLRVLYNNGDAILIPRRSPNNESIHIKSINVAGDNNTLTITDSSDQVYVLGDLSSPVVADAIVGQGAFIGNLGGQLIFKPLVFSERFNNLDDLFGVSAIQGGRVGENYAFARSADHNGTTSAGSWRNRPFTSLSSNIPNSSLVSGSISLPPGSYYVSAMAPSYMTDNSTIRIISGSSVLCQGGGVLARSNVNNVDNQNFISGLFDLTTQSTITLQTMHQTTQSRISWANCRMDLWKLS